MLRLYKNSRYLHLGSGLYIAAALLSIALGAVTGLETVKESGSPDHYSVDGYLLLVEQTVIAAFVSMMLCREFYYGTVRSKLVMGFGKGQFFIAQLLSSAVTAVELQVLFLIPFGVVTYDKAVSRFQPAVLLKTVFILLASCICITAIMCLLTCLLMRPAKAIVLSLLLLFALYMLGSFADRRLSEPETFLTVEHTVTADGSDQTQEIFHTNDSYISGSVRSVYTLIYELDPVCGIYTAAGLFNSQLFTEDDIKAAPQSNVWHGREFTLYLLGRRNVLPLITLLTAFAAAAVGTAAFRKKNIE